MANRYLKKAPLIYTQVSVHFSSLPSKEVASDDALESYHKAMMGFELADRLDSEIRQTALHFNHNDANSYFVQKDSQPLKRIVFRGNEKSTAVELQRNKLVVKTSRYTTHTKMFELVNNILIQAQDHITDLDKVLINQVGIRYIDVVLPKQDKQLEHYIKKELLPYHPESSQSAVGTSQTVAITGDDQQMVILFEELAAGPNGLPERWLPVDLLEPDNNATMVLHPGVDDYGRGNNYAIMSVDHRQNMPKAPQWDIQMINDSLSNLQKVSSDAFWDSITAAAKDEWEETTYG